MLKGRTLTSWPSLKTDLTDAGATWVDQEVAVDRGLVSSRKPDDIPAFSRKLIEEIGRRARAPAQRRLELTSAYFRSHALSDHGEIYAG